MVPGGGQEGSGPAGLTRDRVLDAAMAILLERGLERLTVRALADDLGVAVTAIYWHVGNKQTLLDALVDRIIAELGEVRARGRTPATRIRSVADGLRSALLARPDLVAFVQQQGRVAGLFQPARRALAVELTRAGVAGERAAYGVEAVVLVVVGSVLIDRQVARQPVQSEQPEELWTEADLPGAPGTLVHLTHRLDEDAVFAFSVDALVQSLLTSP